jgi:hypothetical protein
LFGINNSILASEKVKNVENPIYLNIDGNNKKFTFAHSEWKKGVASWYNYGNVTAWCNNRSSEWKWDFGLSKWIMANYPHPHFYWDGIYNGKKFHHKNWHNFNSYKNLIPTFAHKRHEVGTFILFRFGKYTQIALETDHGPYIKGRDFDFNPALKRSLHFDGVGEVEYKILQPKVN